MIADLFADGPGELAPYLFRFATLMALSALIAALGLIGNSAAVVIGAMLVAPLMRPLVALAAAFVLGDTKRQLVSAGLILFAALESIGLASLVAFLVPNFRVVTITTEILFRTAPGLIDLAIAVAAGAAGAYVTVRRRAGGALPGAAIAVALVPPLAAFGILLEQGYSHLARGALLLFLTNLVGIVVASVIVLLLTGFGATRGLSRRHRVAVALPLVAVLAVAFPLERESHSAYQRAYDDGQVRKVLVPLLRSEHLGIQNLTVVEEPTRLVASIDVIGPKAAPSPQILARPLAEQLGRNVTVIVRWTYRDEQIGTASAAG